MTLYLACTIKMCQRKASYRYSWPQLGKGGCLCCQLIGCLKTLAMEKAHNDLSLELPLCQNDATGVFVGRDNSVVPASGCWNFGNGRPVKHCNGVFIDVPFLTESQTTGRLSLLGTFVAMFLQSLDEHQQADL